MSQFDLHLQWERGEAKKRSQQDAFEGSDLELAEEAAEVEVTQHEAEEEPVHAGIASFEWSEDRARAIEAAMRRMGERNEARVNHQLGQYLREGCQPQQLDEMEEWLRQQLSAWQERVALPEDEVDRELAEPFNLALSQAQDGLNLALELVQMLREGTAQPALFEALLSQVNDYFQQARQFLAGSEPYEEEE